MEKLNPKQQELIYQMSIFEQQMNQIQQQMQAVEQGISELGELSQDLEELKGKKDREIMTAVGRGIFVKAKLLSEDLVVDVGGKNFVKKSIDGTKETISTQIEKLEDVYEQLTNAMNELNREVERIVEGVGREE